MGKGAARNADLTTHTMQRRAHHVIPTSATVMAGTALR
jgi:hypothetical protein